jgi:hypothetical protein
MITLLKTDRLVQIMVAGIVIAGCLTCAVFGVIGYLRLAPAADAPAPAAQPLAEAPTDTPMPSAQPPLGTDTPLPGDAAPPTPTNTRVVPPTGTRTATPTAAARPTPTPQPAATPVPDLPAGGEVTAWLRYESAENNLAVNYPVTAKIVEGEGAVQYQATEVTLSQGQIKRPIVNITIYNKNSSYLPAVDRSDPLAMVVALRDIYFYGQESQLHELEPAQVKSFNGYSGASSVVNRIDPGKSDLYGPVDIVFYFATIIHEDRIIRAQIQARKHDGGAPIPAYAEQVLNSIELK